MLGLLSSFRVMCRMARMDGRNIEWYPKLRVYPKYRVIPDDSGYPLPDDFQNWIGSGRVSKEIPGSGSGSGTHWALLQSACIKFIAIKIILWVIMPMLWWHCVLPIRWRLRVGHTQILGVCIPTTNTGRPWSTFMCFFMFFPNNTTAIRLTLREHVIWTWRTVQSTQQLVCYSLRTI